MGCFKYVGSRSWYRFARLGSSLCRVEEGDPTQLLEEVLYGDVRLREPDFGRFSSEVERSKFAVSRIEAPAWSVRTGTRVWRELILAGEFRIDIDLLAGDFLILGESGVRYHLGGRICPVSAFEHAHPVVSVANLNPAEVFSSDLAVLRSVIESARRSGSDLLLTGQDH